MYIYLDGQFVDERCATVSVFDRGFLYGDGVFETMRAYQGRIAWVERHLERLFQSADMIDLCIQQSKQDFTAILRELISCNMIGDAIIRMTITRGVGAPGIDPGLDNNHTTVIAPRLYQPFPPTCYSDGVSLAIVTIKRNPIESMPPSVKSLNFMNNILAKIEATRQCAFDAIMLNQHDHLTETTISNIFLVKNGQLYTPAVTCGILAGITRDVVLSLAQENRISSCQQVLTVEELYSADECFLTNTSMELMPVTQVDSRVIGQGRPGQMTAQLHNAFRKHVNLHLMETK